MDGSRASDRTVVYAWPCLTHRAAAAVALGSIALAIAGCPLPRSEDETLELSGHNIYAPATAEDHAYVGTQPVLVGTELCATLVCSGAGCPTIQDAGTLLLSVDVSACFSHTADGPASITDAGPNCLRFDGEGAVSWRFSPHACEIPGSAPIDGGYSPPADQFILRSTTSTGLVARVDLSLERIALEHEVLEPPSYVFLSARPADFYPAASEQLQFLAGTPVRLPVGLFDIDGSPVGYRRSDAIYHFQEIEPSTDGQPAVAEVATTSGAPVFVFGTGATVKLTIEILGEAFEVGELKGIDAAQVTTLELVAFQPYPAALVAVAGYRAIPRTDDGTMVFGVPVDWEVNEGRFGIVSLGSFTGRTPEPQSNEVLPLGDWIYLDDTCRPESQRLGERNASVVASFGEASATLGITWVQLGDVSPPDDLARFSEPAGCEGPDVFVYDGGVDAGADGGPLDFTDNVECACDQTPGAASGEGAFGLAALVAIAALRRRRRAAARGGSTWSDAV